MKNNKKKIDGCIKIFKFLQLLYEDDAEYSKVLEIFKDEIKGTSTSNTQVALNKYINTLKVFGLKIQKENTKYKLQNSLYSMPFTQSDLKAISIIANSVKNFPESKTATEVRNVLQKLQLRMNKKDKNTLNYLSNSDNFDFTFFYSDLKEQIQQCEQLCAERFMVNILFLKNGQEKFCKGVIKEVIYGCKTVSLNIYDSNNHIMLETPIHNILSLVRLPQIANNIEMATTVVYKLKNRLAITYKLKENEYSDGYNDDGELIVINKDESFDKLLSRLMRYTNNCEIISPKNLRDEMIKLINDTIQNYEEK